MKICIEEHYFYELNMIKKIYIQIPLFQNLSFNWALVLKIIWKFNFEYFILFDLIKRYSNEKNKYFSLSLLFFMEKN